MVSWVLALSYAEIMEPLFLLFFLFVAWPGVALVSRLCAWGWSCGSYSVAVVV